MEKIGIVTVTYNSESVWDKFMESILAQTFTNFILYCIDNKSSDNSLEKIKSYSDPRIVLIANNDNLGVAAGNNIGIKKSLEDNCSHVLLLNNDVEFEDQLIEKLLKGLTDFNCSMSTTKMMYFEPNTKIWCAGANLIARNGYLAIQRGFRQEDKGQFNEACFVDYSPTCCVLFKKEVFDDLGLMDEKYFVYFDDTDFFYRALMDKRHRLIYLPNIKFYHKVGSLTKTNTKGVKEKPQKGNFTIKYYVRNMVYYLKKQKSSLAYFIIFYQGIRLFLRFLFSGVFKRDFKTLKLIYTSYFEGLNM